MKIKMLCFCFLSLLAMNPAIFAGKTELTAYYPPPTGRYLSLNSGNFGIGTTAPAAKLHVVPSASGNALFVDRYGTGTGNASWGYGVKNASDTDSFFMGHTSSAYVGISWLAPETSFIYYPTELRIGAGTGSTPVMTFTSTGKIGIGVATPTVQFERACPSGFTNIKAGNNQLGCMQTAEAQNGTWELAQEYCLVNFGGRLPTAGEWYFAMVNFALTDETDDQERNDDATGSNAHTCSGPAITTTAACGDATMMTYRCWVPR